LNTKNLDISTQFETNDSIHEPEHF